MSTGNSRCAKACWEAISPADLWHARRVSVHDNLGIHADGVRIASAHERCAGGATELCHVIVLQPNPLAAQRVNCGSGNGGVDRSSVVAHVSVSKVVNQHEENMLLRARPWNKGESDNEEGGSGRL